MFLSIEHLSTVPGLAASERAAETGCEFLFRFMINVLRRQMEEFAHANEGSSSALTIRDNAFIFGRTIVIAPLARTDHFNILHPLLSLRVCVCVAACSMSHHHIKAKCIHENCFIKYFNGMLHELCAVSVLTVTQRHCVVTTFQIDIDNGVQFVRIDGDEPSSSVAIIVDAWTHMPKSSYYNMQRCEFELFGQQTGKTHIPLTQTFGIG